MDVPELDNAGLRKFGLTTGAIIVVLFALFFPWVFDVGRIPMWPWIIAGALWLPALLVPTALRPIYTTWMKIGHGIGWVNTRIILGVLFYVLVLPMGVVMRLVGNDPMARKRDDAAVSYRKQSVSEPKERLEKPY
jgi:Saxitoxin biosynthesis operon protein SxtJ